ncbi:MAG: DUF2147 domain-containing protein [Mizugakiibacter sp.]|uniref:DUF2147 domain-containing protein n=1 Tax=Mizugakiibacter sp. TaxID=1972610 RepID=UPI0031C154DE|nr:DUF2147 domain-containing protein [Xanthomonadaceae bacterium]
MRNLLRGGLVAACLFVASYAFAASDSPVGVWKTIDDVTGKPKSLVEITEHNGVLQGKVLQVLQSDQGPHPICDKCAGERHNKPVEGMTIIWDMQNDDGVWTGGHILDPKNGKTYGCKITLIENGAKLKVRGFIGFALIGRTQVWERQQ